MRKLLLLVPIATLACGASGGELRTLDLGYAGASESFVWFEYERIRVTPLSWLHRPLPCDGYEEIANCRIPRWCPGPAASPSTYEQASPIDPGQIIVAGVPLVFDPLQNWSSASFSPPLPLGERIGFTVAGPAEVPAHEGEFTIPPAIAILEPDISRQVVIDRSQNLVVKWVPTDSGDVTAGVYDDFDPYTSVSCTAPALAGELEIPAELLAGLPDTADEGRKMSFVAFRDGQVTTVGVGTWTVRMTAVGPDVRAQVDVN